MYTLLRVKNELCDSRFLNTNLGNVNTHYIPSEGILTQLYRLHERLCGLSLFGY